MATRNFFVITLFATLIGIGMAELVRPALHTDYRDPRASMIGMCVNSGIGCSDIGMRQASF